MTLQMRQSVIFRCRKWFYQIVLLTSFFFVFNSQKVNWGVQLYWLVWRSSIDMKRSKQDALIRFTLYMVNKL